MSDVVWRHGMAAVVRAEWPAYALGPADPGGWVMVRFLEGARPRDCDREDWIHADELTRPHAPQLLDRLKLEKPFTRGDGPWTGEQLRLLRKLWPTHRDDQVAKRCGHSAAACQAAVYRWWGSKRREIGLTVRDVAAILGCDGHRLDRFLIPKGYLRAGRSWVKAGGHSRRWRIETDELRRFLREHPTEYDVAGMPPGPWRDEAERLQGGERWLTIKEAAARLYVDPGILKKHVKRGWLPATWSNGGFAGRSYGWRIRESDLPKFEASPRHRILASVRAAVHARGLLMASEAAAELGVTRAVIDGWIRRHGYPAESVTVGKRTVKGVRLPVRIRPSWASEAAACPPPSHPSEGVKP